MLSGQISHCGEAPSGYRVAQFNHPGLATSSELDAKKQSACNTRLNFKRHPPVHVMSLLRTRSEGVSRDDMMGVQSIAIREGRVAPGWAGGRTCEVLHGVVHFSPKMCQDGCIRVVNWLADKPS